MDFFEKRNNLDYVINTPIKAEERSGFQILFGIQGPNILDRHNPESASEITADPRSTVFSKSANPLDLLHKFTIHALFEAKSVDPKTYSPPQKNYTEDRNQQKLKASARTSN